MLMSSSRSRNFGLATISSASFKHEPRQVVIVERAVAQLFEAVFGQHFGIGEEPPRQPRQARLAAAVGIVRLLQAVHEPAQIVVGVVGDVGRHLRIAEVGLALAMRRRAQRAQEMRLAGAGLAVEQQNARLLCRAAPLRDGLQQILELAPRLGMHLGHVHGIGAPDIVLPGDRMLERLDELVSRNGFLNFAAHKSSHRRRR